MCGIAGILNLSNRLVFELENSLATLNRLQKHRGPFRLSGIMGITGMILIENLELFLSECFDLDTNL